MDIKEGKSISQTLEIDYAITTVAYDSGANKLAIGTEKGKIVQVSNFSSNKPQMNVYHWHSMPVGALKYLDSSTLLSGG